MVKSDWGGKVSFEQIDKAIRSDNILLGYPDGLPHNKGGINLDEIALINSESETHPRPFLSDGIKANLDQINKAIEIEYIGMIKGNTPNLDKIGVIALTGIQEFVRGSYYKENSPNSELTIKRKTSKKGCKSGEFKDKPLIDTSQTINGLTYTTEKI